MATVFCFSATGNSLYAANRIADKISASVVSMTKDITECKDDIIGFVFPTYFWGLPETVTEFINRLSITNTKAYIFAVNTCGGPIIGVLGMIKSLLNKKGAVLSYGAKVIMVENYSIDYKVNDNPKIHEKSDKKINMICNSIIERQHNFAGYYTLINKIIYSIYSNKEKRDSHFTVNSNCSNCGICQKICPKGNIGIKDNRPEYKHNCELCLACIHACPKHAIEYNNLHDKTQYRNPHISLNMLLDLNQKG